MVSELLDLLMGIRPFLGFMTFSIALIGFTVALYHYFFFLRSEEKTARRVRMVFLTDALIYMTVMAFGMAAWMHWPIEVRNLFQLLREPVMIANIIASIRLYIHLKQIK